MKRIQKLLCVLAVLCLLLALPVPALAADGSGTDLDALYKDKSWDEVIDEFLARYNTNPNNITLGYYNTVTGEEHYLNADQYMVTGSMYKVPLNMAFAEKVANGEMEWDTKIGTLTLAQIRDETIIYSNNDLARTLWTKLSNNGGYHLYREIIAPLMGEDAETVDQKYYENNFFTPRQMIYCLKLLYDNPDRFPTIVETMQKAEPSKYFKLRERRFDIAHKYGYLVTDYHLYINDCGIAFTDDPILLVIFTDNVDKVYSVITEYCTLMCDYAQYHTAERLAAEKAEAEAEAALAEAQAAAEAEAQAAAEARASSPLSSLFTRPEQDDTQPEPEQDRSAFGFAPFLAAIVIVVGYVVFLALLLRWRRRYGLRPAWAVLSALLCAAALLLCTLAVSAGTLVARPKGDPQDAVREFFDAVQAGDYEAANACLGNYATLGLENEPGGEAGRLLHEALRQSYSYSLIGQSTVNELSARQQLQLRYLDVASLESDTRDELENVIASLARSRDPKEVYDADNNYLPAFAMEAYAQALSGVLSHASDYYATAGIQLTLDYSGGRWRILPDESLLKALAGGLSY
ncbi:MAG: hypothetical protein IJ594_07110 [Oscillospiraceae bacterium]|nr:hypothetical protein [Oscillospiraceae bacterium]